jgi:hypothetical protein
MAFNKIGPPVFIWNSSSLRIGIRYGSGDDKGAQWIMADPEVNAQSPWGDLKVNDQTKIRYPIYRVDFDAGSGSYSGSAVEYWVTVTNNAGYAQWFTLQGGGNT